VAGVDNGLAIGHLRRVVWHVALYPALTVSVAATASGIIGVLYTGCTIGTFIGPLLAGAAFDAFGSYTLPIAASIVFALVATVLIMRSPEAPGCSTG
jgi:MFS family permease